MRLSQLVVSVCLFLSLPIAAYGATEPGDRSLLSAHNCYPYHGMWSDRIDRALSTGYPLSIEQDLCWAQVDGMEAPRSLVAHNGPYNTEVPTLEEHFFERVRADVEASLKRARTDASEREHWPMIVLDLDIKDNKPAHIDAIVKVLKQYQGWLTTAPRAETIDDSQELDLGPIMVILTGSDNQRRVLHDELEIGEPILAFGRCKTNGPDTSGMSDEQKRRAIASFPPERMVPSPADNFHRWWNNSWHVVEAGGANRAGEWTEAEAARLQELVDHAHRMGYLIRFYTINGHSSAVGAAGGYGGGYNTGSIQAAQTRWRAQIEAGVDLIATDQYVHFGRLRDSISD